MLRAPDQFDVAHLVGTPFAYGARGPDAYDCYGLVMHLHALQGIRLPDYASPHDQPDIAALMGNALTLWQSVHAPEGGVVAVFRIGKLISHCAVLLDHDRFVHAWEGSDQVVIEKLSENGWQRRLYDLVRYVQPD